jgi:NhaP-type Na+/H+ or K+/H+ antiporter
VDDVFVIVIFSIFLGIYKGGEVHLWQELLNIPVSITLGILVGLIPGYFLYRLFQKFDFRPPKRTMIVLGTAVFLTGLERAFEQWMPIASLLGVMAIGFIILEKSEPIAHIISQKLKKLWVFAELLLFVLVGAQVNIHVAFETGLAGIAVICFGLIARSVGVYISLFGTNLTFSEKMFCIVAYIPKATVQAAIGAVPLAAGVASGDVILAVAVLSILITAPIGAVGIMIMGERVLDYGENMPFKFRELREQLGLPHVGERIRSKTTGEVWKVIAEREGWASPEESTESQHKPVIAQRYWLEADRTAPGTGKTQWVRFSSDSRAGFSNHWEVLYDW